MQMLCTSIFTASMILPYMTVLLNKCIINEDDDKEMKDIKIHVYKKLANRLIVLKHIPNIIRKYIIYNIKFFYFIIYNIFIGIKLCYFYKKSK